MAKDMDNLVLLARLYAIRMWLLVILTGVLMLGSSFAYWRYTVVQKELASKNVFWCGTEPMSTSTNSLQHSIGKELFIANCASCHAKNMKTALTGPALGGVMARWAKYPKKDLYDYSR